MAPKVKQYKLPATLELWSHVSVTWEDAMTDPGGHKAEDFVKNWKQCIRRTSGYVIEYNDTHIFLVASDDRDTNTDQDCEDATVIPLPYVRRIVKK
jgi:hypothetical protein